MASFDYTSRDYLSIRQDLFDRASSLIPEWTTRNPADFGVLMVDLWAYYADILHYYVDRAAAETYLRTATQKSSVIALANLFDYRPSFQTSAIGTVTVTATNAAHSNTIVIPENTEFIAPATSTDPIVYFTSTSSASITVGNTIAVIPVTEGRRVELESPTHYITGQNLSDGLSGQRFNLRYPGVIASSVKVYVYEGTIVNGSPTAVEYSYFSDFAIASSDSRAFTLEITADGVMQVIFGNGVNGKIPPTGAEVSVTYRYGQGVAGNIAAGRIKSYGVGSTVNDTFISSSTSTSGGADSESLESMKANIPLMFRTQDRAVSKQDFKDLALRVPQVVKATCSVSGSNVTVYAIPYVSNYLDYSSSTLTISQDIKDNIITYFEPRTLVGASVGAASSVTLKPVNITATIHVLPQYVNEWVKTSALEAINNFFTFENVSFGQVLSIGAIYRALQNVTGVDYITISVFSFTSGTSNTLTAGDTELLRKGTISLTATGGITGSLV